MKRLLLRVLRSLLLIYGGVLVLLAGCQRRLIYFPDKLTTPAALSRAEREGAVPWRDAQGAIIGWRIPNPAARARLIVFHGNAGCALDRTYYSDTFGTLHGGADWEVSLFEYPGYGARDGSPSKDAFLAAGRAAMKGLLAENARPLFLLGESIGSGTACALAGAEPDRVAGLILVVPFARLQEVAQAKFPFLPTGLLLRDKFDNLAALAAYHRPIAFVVAAEDEVVGPEQGKKLHAAYAGPKLLLVVPGSGHNSLPMDAHAEWIREASAFVLEKKP